MKWLLSISFILSAMVLLGYAVDAAIGKKTVAGDWVMPLASVACVIVIPATWIAFLRAEKEKRGRAIPHLILVPFWLHGLVASLLLIGWMATGGL